MDYSTGICVQCGIMDHAEYMYLAEPDWLSRMESVAENRAIPHQLCGFQTWEYYAIDADCSSMQHLIQTYTPRANVHWVLAFVSGNRDCGYDHSYLKPVVDTPMWLAWTRGDMETEVPRYLIPTVSLQELLSGLNLDKVDVLALDIEGAEIPLFETYSWQIEPAFINVEVHTYPEEPRRYDVLCQNRDRLIEIITAAGRGYQLSFSEDTNLVDDIIYSHELHFLRRDLVDGSNIYGVIS